MKDNAKLISEINTQEEHKLTLKEIAEARHAARTKAQEDAIIKRWLERQDLQQYTDEQIENFSEIERDLSVKRGLSMSHVEANQDRPNPKYGTSWQYGENCQSCVITYELRRRGFDLETLPKSTALQRRLSYDTNLLWIDPKTGKPPVLQRAGGAIEFKRGSATLKPKSKKAIAKDFEAMTAEQGRYHMTVIWKGGKSGHIVTCERLKDGTLRIYDPQTGKLHNLQYYLDNIQTARGIAIQRVDNLILTTGKFESTPKPLTQVLKKSGTPTPRITKQVTSGGGIAGAPKTPLSKEVKQRRSEIRQQAKALTSQTITHSAFNGKQIGLSNGGVKEWLNQPHEQYAAKNELLLRIHEELPKMKYVGYAVDKRNDLINAHLFETMVEGVPSWVIVREYPNGNILLHSISDQASLIDLIVK